MTPFKSRAEEWQHTAFTFVKVKGEHAATKGLSLASRSAGMFQGPPAVEDLVQDLTLLSRCADAKIKADAVKILADLRSFQPESAAAGGAEKIGAPVRGTATQTRGFLAWLKGVFGRERPAVEATRDGLIDVPLDCPRCQHQWTAGFRKLNVPTRVLCPRCGWQGTMSING